MTYLEGIQTTNLPTLFQSSAAPLDLASFPHQTLGSKSPTLLTPKCYNRGLFHSLAIRLFVSQAYKLCAFFFLLSPYRPCTFFFSFLCCFGSLYSFSYINKLWIINLPYTQRERKRKPLSRLLHGLLTSARTLMPLQVILV